MLPHLHQRLSPVCPTAPLAKAAQLLGARGQHQSLAAAAPQHTLPKALLPPAVQNLIDAWLQYIFGVDLCSCMWVWWGALLSLNHLRTPPPSMTRPRCCRLCVPAARAELRH